MSSKTFSLGQEQIRFRQGKFVDGPAANLAINVFVESVYEEMQLMVVTSQQQQQLTHHRSFLLAGNLTFPLSVACSCIACINDRISIY